MLGALFGKKQQQQPQQQQQQQQGGGYGGGGGQYPGYNAGYQQQQQQGQPPPPHNPYAPQQQQQQQQPPPPHQYQQGPPRGAGQNPYQQGPPVAMPVGQQQQQYQNPYTQQPAAGGWGQPQAAPPAQGGWGQPQPAAHGGGGWGHPQPQRQPSPPVAAPAPYSVARPAGRSPPAPAAAAAAGGGGGGAEEEPPSRYLCPITMEIMQDPVMSRSGINYEKVAIEHWLTSHKHCPSTREEMTKNDLFPNRALKEEIEQWRTRAGRGGARTPPAVPVQPPVAAHHRPLEAAPDRPWEKYRIGQDEFDYICALFINFDDDDGGTLDRQELTRLAKWLNYPHTDQAIDAMFAAMDSDGDGALSMDEFLSYYVDKKPDPQCLYGMNQREYNEMLIQFHSVDGDNNGELDPDEFFQLCKRAGYASSKAQADGIFRQVDADGGGTIDLHEFLTYMRPFRTG